ncbi:hypothetical protein B0T19DRAFT_189991 [Cercophora scortea]|uniref:Uncharacterized protein n=1 Tax=Cercophora scortea TaxID=314031 RepID=A0AAE0INT0_9PEZI|nr:hypothetical protein B0T19DRAFT_189991 [Cercophora scortea]
MPPTHTPQRRAGSVCGSLLLSTYLNGTARRGKKKGLNWEQIDDIRASRPCAARDGSSRDGRRVCVRACGAVAKPDGKRTQTTGWPRTGGRTQSGKVRVHCVLWPSFLPAFMVLNFILGKQPGTSVRTGASHLTLRDLLRLLLEKGFGDSKKGK